MNKKLIRNKGIPFLLIVSLLVSVLYGCGKRDIELPQGNDMIPIDSAEVDTAEIVASITEQLHNEYTESDDSTNLYVNSEVSFSESIRNVSGQEQIIYEGSIGEFVKNLFIRQYEYIYEVFPAEIYLNDGTVLEGIGFTDYSAYFEDINGEGGFFAAGFVSFDDCEVSDEEKDEGIIVYNLEYEDAEYGFVLAIDTEAYFEHCVVDNKYVQYGVNENGSFTYIEQDYQRGYCDEELGALYSYDDNRYLFDPEVGNYVYLTGESLVTRIDYAEYEREINRVLDNQDFNFADYDIETQAYISKEAVTNYLLSLQEETFVGVKVSELLDILETLDPTECIRMTPDGALVLSVDSNLPTEATTLTKWLVGTGCILNVAGCIVLTVFVPAGTVAWSALSATTIEIFMQVVVENKNLENVQWSKVGISALTGALLSWACPAGASAVTGAVYEAGGSMALQKLAGYGMLTLSNAAVSAATNASFAAIDGKSEDEIWNAALMGAVIGGALTVASSALSEAVSAGMKALAKSNPNNWFIKLTGKASTFIKNHQVHIDEKWENILVPKSVYETARLSKKEIEAQRIASGFYTHGGSYHDLPSGLGDKHEMPSFSSVKNVTGEDKRYHNPAIIMSPEDHKLTASYGSSSAAKEYQKAQQELLEQGKIMEAIQMDIDDIRSKFGNKYDEAIEEALKYVPEFIEWFTGL